VRLVTASKVEYSRLAPVRTIGHAIFRGEKRDIFRVFHFDPLTVLQRYEKRTKRHLANQSSHLACHALNSHLPFSALTFGALPPLFSTAATLATSSNEPMCVVSRDIRTNSIEPLRPSSPGSNAMLKGCRTINTVPSVRASVNGWKGTCRRSRRTSDRTTSPCVVFFFFIARSNLDHASCVLFAQLVTLDSSITSRGISFISLYPRFTHVRLSCTTRSLRLPKYFRRAFSTPA
jgi:hypothetical protein